MTNWQESHIEKNKSILIEKTILSPLLMADLESGIFSSYDKYATTSDSQPTPMDKANRMYEIAATKTGSYDELTRLFLRNKMTGPLEILLEGYKVNNAPIPVEWIFTDKPEAINNVEYRRLASQSIKVKVHDEDFILGDILPSSGENESTYTMLHNFVRDAQHVEPISLFKPETHPNPAAETKYISRKLSIRNKVMEELFTCESTKDHIFLFRGASQSKLDEIGNYDAKVACSGDQLHEVNAKLIKLDNEGDFLRICKLTREPVHLIQYQEEASIGSYFWIKSSTKSNLLRKKFLNDVYCTLDETKLIDNDNNDFSCPRVFSIAGSEGMGKSMLLKNLARNFRNHRTVSLYIVLNKFVSHLDCSPDCEPLEQVFSYVCPTEQSKELVRVLVVNEGIKLQLFFDGYDDMTINARQKIDEFLRDLANLGGHKIELFVASRGYLRSELEDVFNSLSYKMCPLSYYEQIDFLTHYWGKNVGAKSGNALKDFGEKCLKILQNTLTDSKCETTGIPLHCEHLAKVFGLDALRTSMSATEANSNLILKMYENIVQFKFERISVQEERDKLRLCHVHAALKTLYGEGEWLTIFEQRHSSNWNVDIDLHQIYSVGLIEEGFLSATPKFIHITFAQFILSQYLVEKSTTIREYIGFIIRAILTGHCSAISSFLNMHLNHASIPININIEIDPQVDSIDLCKALEYCCRHNLRNCFRLVANSLKEIERSSPLWIKIKNACFKILPHLVIENTNDFEFVQEVMAFTKQEFIEPLSFYAKEPKEYFSLFPGVVDFTPVHTAILLGKYNVVQSFKKEYENEMKSMKLMHFCVAESCDDSDAIISEKCRIMGLLQHINPKSVMEEVNGVLPRLCINIHPKLLDRLAEIEAKQKSTIAQVV